jgi:peptide/nickel transport system substrate-binding protein
VTRPKKLTIQARRLLPVPLAFILGVPLVATSQNITVAPAAFSRDFKQPTDEVRLVDGKKIRVAPVPNFPGTPPNLSDPLECEPIERPGQILKIPAGEVQAILHFETTVLDKVDQALKNAAADPKARLSQLEAAEKDLQQLGVWHESRRSHPPLAANPWAPLRGRVADRLLEVRRDRLALISQTAVTAQEWSGALRLAEAWLAQGPSLRDQARSLWVRYGEVKMKEGDLAKVRLTLDRLDQEFLHSPQAEPLRRTLEARAQALAQEAKDLPADGAVRKLEEALALWPRAPGLRNDLEKLKKTYRVLHVAVRNLPENLSPATAWTDAERGALDLVFDRLVQVQLDDVLGQRYLPDLAKQLPHPEGTRLSVQLRRDAYWSDGERLTTADVRHTAQLSGRTSMWRDLVSVPRFEGDPFSLTFSLKQGLLDPLAPLRFHVLPEKYRGQPLSRADDPDFAKEPVGSGPFVYLGHRKEGTREYALFQANPNYVRLGKKTVGSIREIRMTAWSDPERDLGKPLPHLVLDVPSRYLVGLRKAGYANVYSVPGRRVYFLAVNHRVPNLANENLRRALAHAIPRSQILKDHFGGPETATKFNFPLRGPFPADCWATAPLSRVPDYQAELAKSFAKKAGQELGQIRLTLKFPADDPGAKEACAALAAAVTKTFSEAQATIIVALAPLAPQKMRTALHERDYDLAYHHRHFPDNNFWLWPLFDPHPDALRPGGSNFLGYDNDAKLQSLLRSAMSQRHFPTVQELEQSIHSHLHERMPLIPLWQLPENVAVHPSLVAPGIDPGRVFGNILDWKVN